MSYARADVTVDDADVRALRIADDRVVLMCDAGTVTLDERTLRRALAVIEAERRAGEEDPATCAHDREIIGGTCSDCAAPVAVAGHLPGCHASGLGPPRPMGDADWTGCGCPAHEEDR